MSTVPTPIPAHDPGGVRTTVRAAENVIDVWDSDDLALSLDFAEARRLVDDITLILSAFGGEQS